jgi:hypothetical protein
MPPVRCMLTSAQASHVSGNSLALRLVTQGVPPACPLGPAGAWLSSEGGSARGGVRDP